jgi:hypothetical protein
MCADGGKGDVDPTRKNIKLLDSTTEKLSACRDASGTGYWILGHKMYSNLFYAWHLTQAGLSAPMISSIGEYHGSGQNPGKAQGQMKISPQGNKVAITISNQEPAVAEIFTFNNAAGILSNSIHLVGPQLGLGYGIEFSPDGTKLFWSIAGGRLETMGLYQFNLNSWSQSTIDSSRIRVADEKDGVGFGLQLGIDGRIYNTNVFDYKKINVINNPNAMGAIDFKSGAITLTGSATATYTFPGCIAGFYYYNKVPECNKSSRNGNDGGKITIFPNPTNGQFIINCPGDWEGILFDDTGRRIAVFTGNGRTSVQKTVPRGIYFLFLKSAVGSVVKKLLFL